MTILQILLINIGAAITALGGVFLKRLSSGLDFSSNNWVWDLVSRKEAWLGGFCYLIPIILWTYMLKTMELTKLQPALSIVYVYTIGLAYLFLDEKPSILRLTGIAIVIVGVFIVGKS